MSVTIQQCIQHSKITIVGIGGIGSILSLYVCQFLNSLRRECDVYLIDGDTYEPRNSQRMLFSRLEKKAVVKAEELGRLFGRYLRVHPVAHYLTQENIAEYIGEGDVIFLCVDNHASRLLVSNHNQKLQSVVLISGGNDGVENGKDGTFGNVQLFIRCDGRNVTNSLTRFHPEIEHPADRPPEGVGCEEMAGSSAPQLLFTNLAVASAMLNTFYCCLYDELTYEEVYLNIKAGRMTPVKRKVEQ